MLKKGKENNGNVIVSSNNNSVVLKEKPLLDEGRRLVLERISGGRNGIRLILCRENADSSINWDVQSIFAGVYADLIDESNYYDFFEKIKSVQDFHDLSNNIRDKIIQSISVS